MEKLQFISIELTDMVLKVMILVHLYFLLGFPIPKQAIYLDPRLEEYVWFEEPHKSPRQDLGIDFLEKNYLEGEPTKTDQANQTIKGEINSNKESDQESFAKYFFSNKWK